MSLFKKSHKPTHEPTAVAGAPLAPGVVPADRDTVIEALKTVYDPEIPVNIFDLGLIYDLTVEDDGRVAIAMTLTAPSCPVAGGLPSEVAEAVAAAPGVGPVTVDLVWDPPWTMDRLSEEARLTLNLY